MLLLGVSTTFLGVRYFMDRQEVRAAQSALERRDWTAARQHAERALARSPNDPDLLLMAARAARRQEALYDAQKLLDSCQHALGEESEPIKVERALLNVHRGNLAGVEAYLQARVREGDPAILEILDIMSAALIIDYRVAAAQSCLDDLLSRQPDHFDALVRRGWTARNMGWYADAVKFYQKALELRPDVDAVRLALAELEVALGKFSDAQQQFELLRRKQPNNPSVLFGLGRAFAGQGQKEQARELLDQVLAATTQDWKALSERGWIAVELDQPKEGEVYLRSALALAPPDLQLLTRLADCLRLNGKQEEARQYRERADRVRADLQRAGELGDLIRDKNPAGPTPRYELGSVLLRLGKKQDALHWLITALDQDPGHVKTHELLIEIYQSVGDVQRAEQHRRFLEGVTAKPPGSSL
jgi:tetratricopeptide (TPR) repeat protein